MYNKIIDTVKDKFYDFWGDLSDEFKKGFSIAIVALFLFSVGNILGSLSNVNITQSEGGNTEQVQQSETQPAPETTVTQAPTTQAPVVTQAPVTQAPVVDAGATTAAPGVTDAPAASTGTPATPAEIIALFNESANKVKTDATKVVKNFENRTHNEELLILHSSLEGMANSLMQKYFQNDTTPIEYATKEDIVANYQVPGQTWVSQLTEAEVAEATCTDNGTEYEVMLKLHTTQNPENGVGVSKAVDTITSSEIMENAPSMVQSFETEYYDCVIKCKIDKATGRTTWSSYTTPVILKLKVNIPVVGEFDAQVGMTFEKDYTITY